jgi:SAM-dependent methyltransferase
MTEHEHEHDADDLAQILDLDAEVLADLTASITAWLPVTDAPRRIADLGAGTGAGTLALLRRFPEAEVTAVDASPAYLHRLREKAEAEGVADRIKTLQADLDAQWPDLGAPELIWASASLHHLADPDRTLKQIHDTLAPGGLFALVEPAGFPRFLPQDAPQDRPGLEERCHAALADHHAEQLPHLGADWSPRLTAAGFTIAGQHTINVHLEAPPTEATRRYAFISLRRMRDRFADSLQAEDVAALDRLLDTDGPHGILRRNDLTVRAERTVWAARRAYQ